MNDQARRVEDRRIQRKRAAAEPNAGSKRVFALIRQLKLRDQVLACDPAAIVRDQL